MLPELKTIGGEVIQFTRINSRNYSGDRLPGAEIHHTELSLGAITIQLWHQPLAAMGLRLLRFIQRISITVLEKESAIRLEAVINGQLRIEQKEGSDTNLLPGQYWVTDQQEYSLKGQKDHTTQYFVSHYSVSLLKDFGVSPKEVCSAPRVMHPVMVDLLHDLLHTPYHPEMREQYYEESVRQLLIMHLTYSNILPSKLSKEDMAVIYQADAIIQQNPGNHYTIEHLSKMVGTNSFKLKRGFRVVFGMGIFGRLFHRRMEQAKRMLDSTDLEVLDIGEELGYNSVTGFIRAFRRRFGMTPLQWKERKR